MTEKYIAGTLETQADTAITAVCRRDGCRQKRSTYHIIMPDPNTGTYTHAENLTSSKIPELEQVPYYYLISRTQGGESICVYCLITATYLYYSN